MIWMTIPLNERKIDQPTNWAVEYLYFHMYNLINYKMDIWRIIVQLIN
jgi:hypothetical protein